MKKSFRCDFKGCKAILSTKHIKQRHVLLVHKTLPIKNLRDGDRLKNCISGNNQVKQMIPDQGFDKTLPSKKSNRKKIDEDLDLPEKCGALSDKIQNLGRRVKDIDCHRVKCPLENCESIFKSSYIRKHIRLCHKDFEVCKECKMWTPIVDFPTHVKNCEKEREKKQQEQLVCPYENCNASFTSVRNKRRHFQNIHGERVKCIYESCNAFIKPRHLSEHVKRWHLQIKQYCNKCNRWLLLRSFRAHSKKCNSNVEKKFRCTYKGCTVQFSTLGNRTNHLITVHKSFEKQTRKK